ncbi:DUF2807 domain-containing protein [Sphingosinicellaceae bacterium]|nr:DUF2807 domain-containing protein [Sphingosinicellaceae bacterium]
MIRTAAIAAALLASAATGASAAEQSFPVGNFDRIALGGSPEVTVTTGAAASVRATGEQQALDRLDIRVEAGVLRIGNKRGSGWNWSGGNRSQVRIAVTVPMVRGVEIGGSGSVAVDRVKVPAFVASVGGSGSMRIGALDTRDASFSIAGSGNVTVDGRCDTAKIDVAGSGRLRLGGFKCHTLSASIAGSGNIDATATQTASVSVMGSGDARIGGGAVCSVSKHGSGSVICGTNSIS